MHAFSSDEARRWSAWQHETALGARHSDLIVRACGVTIMVASFIALVGVLWQR